jgi:chloride channel 3/4/5
MNSRTAVMVAKWVGDYFNKDGIYDCLIKLNGYPFLDDKEDYIETATASDLMIPVTKLRYLQGIGETIDSIEAQLHETDVKGFPVISDPRERFLLGYAGRAEIQYAVRQARRRRLVTGETKCNFMPPNYQSTAASAREDSPRIFVDTFGDMGVMESQSVVPLEENVMLPPSLKESPVSSASETASDPRQFLDFKSWIDQTPVTVSPKCPMEIVLELFRKLGLRYVLVTYQGRLEGLLTKKDLLAHLQQVRGEVPEGVTIRLESHIPPSAEQPYQSLGQQQPPSTNQHSRSITA